MFHYVISKGYLKEIEFDEIYNNRFLDMKIYLIYIEFNK